MKQTLYETKVLHVLYADMNGEHFGLSVGQETKLSVGVHYPILDNLQDGRLFYVKWKEKKDFYEIIISILTQLLPDKQNQRKYEWLYILDESPKLHKKLSLFLEFLWIVLILQKKRFPQLPKPSINQQLTLIQLLFTSSLFIIFQIISIFSSWLVTHNPIVASLIVFISLKVLSNIYQSTKTSSPLSRINLWSFFQIGILSSYCVLAFKFHNAEGQLLLLTLLTLHLLFFQPLTKEIITLLQEWREQSDNDLSKR